VKRIIQSYKDDITKILKLVRVMKLTVVENKGEGGEGEKG
jgi:hypothetical protein